MTAKDSRTSADSYETHIGRVVRGAGVTLFGQGVGRVLGYATQAVIARVFGPAQLGLYVLGQTIVTLANILSMAGIDNGVVRCVARYAAEEDWWKVRRTVCLAIGSTLLLSIVLSVGIFTGAEVLAFEVFEKPLLEQVFQAFAPALPFFTIMSVALFATQGLRVVKYTAYVQEILRPLLGLGLLVGFYLLGVGIMGAIAAYVLSMIVGAVAGLIYLARLLPPRSSGMEAQGGATDEVAKELASSSPMMIARLSSYVGAWGMIWVLGVFVPAREVGIYNAAFRTAALSELVLFAFSRILSPMISGLYGRGSTEHLERLYKDVSRWVLMGSLAIFVPTVLFARDVLTLFGPEFISAWPVVVVIAAGYLFASSVGLSGRMLAMTGNERVVMWCRAIGTVAALFCGILLVPIAGMIGAAIAAASGVVLLHLLMLYCVKRRLECWPYSVQVFKPLVASLLAGAGAWVVRSLLDPAPGLWALAVAGSLFGVLYLGLVLAFRLSRADVQFLGALWTALTGRELPRGTRK